MPLGILINILQGLRFEAALKFGHDDGSAPDVFNLYDMFCSGGRTKQTGEKEKKNDTKPLNVFQYKQYRSDSMGNRRNVRTWVKQQENVFALDSVHCCPADGVGYAVASFLLPDEKIIINVWPSV